MKKAYFAYINFNDSDFIFDDYDYFNIKSISDLKKVKKINCDYIVLCSSNVTFSSDINFDKIFEFMSEKNIDLFSFLPCNEEHKKLLNFNKSGFYNVKDGYFNLNYDTYIIKKSLLDNCKFKGNFETFIVELLENNCDFYLSCDDMVIKEENEFLDVNWYNESFKLFIKNISNSLVNQNMYFNLYVDRLRKNIGFVNKNILNYEQKVEFLNLSKLLLQKIDDSLINIDNISKNKNIVNNIIYYILDLKHEGKKYNVDGNNILFNNNIIGKVSDFVLVRSINVVDDKIEMFCSYDKISFELVGLDLFLNNKKFNYKSNNIYDDFKVFGDTYYKNFNFSFSVDIQSVSNINFKNSDGKKLKMHFPFVGSRLNHMFNGSYWNVSNKYLKYVDKTIFLENNTILKNFINEFLYDLKILKKEKFSFKSIFCILIRILYYFIKPFYKNKKIWITFDKLYKGGDCGEYFFKYVSDNTSQKIYYIVNKNTKTYYKLTKKYKNILCFGSLKCMLLSLYASDIFETEFTAISFCGFSPFLIKYCKDLFNADIHCIQHGLTMQNIPHNQNKLNDNLKYYFVASKYEVKNLLKSEYGYDKNNIILTGIPRFDGLCDKRENVILLSPTWRVDIASKGKSGKIRGRNAKFKDTKYFKVYNSLINNKILLEQIQKFNYKIKFLIHPTLISNKDDYDKNEYVEIISTNEIDYEDVLTTSKVMITDYSGVQYDFAYMKKPILYYHNLLLPPSYDNGMMDYDKIGFGAVVKTENELINRLIDIINNDCTIEKKYEKRIEDFFEFNDFDNSKRIYEFMLNNKK